MTLTFGSLFAGIGGLDLGLERAGMQCAWQVEIDDYATRVLSKHWPNVPRFRDVRSVGVHNLPAVDLLCGGFPCQDIADPGKRVGITGERSGLWIEFNRIICELRPRFVIVENVSALLDRGIDTVLGDLAAGGYDAEWSVLSSCAMGAPHTRERVFIVAYPYGKYGQARMGTVAHGPSANEHRNDSPSAGNWLSAASRFPRGTHGIPNRMDRTARLGNAVDPRVAEFIGRQIVEFDHA
jgi:DNA (cytosine-5)-methyltransferase 1